MQEKQRVLQVTRIQIKVCDPTLANIFLTYNVKICLTIINFDKKHRTDIIGIIIIVKLESS